MTRKQCPHALAIITTNRQAQLDLYVDKYFSIDKLHHAYCGMIPNISDRGQGIQVVATNYQEERAREVEKEHEPWSIGEKWESDRTGEM